jgi:NAD+ synthase
MSKLDIDESSVAKCLESFLKSRLAHSGLNGFVVGLSGGIDSSLATAIAARAVGANKITGFIMPYSQSSNKSEEDALELASKMHFKTDKISISSMIDAYYPDISQIDPVRAGNKMARERMSILFDKAFELNCLVLGTSNRTEICLGYGTWFGDVASSVNPIGMLFKTQVRQLARYYDIPKPILHKVPSADQLLYAIIEDGICERGELNEIGFEDGFIDRTVALVNKFYFKRHLPEIADLGLKQIPDRININ